MTGVRRHRRRRWPQRAGRGGLPGPGRQRVLVLRAPRTSSAAPRCPSIRSGPTSPSPRLSYVVSLLPAGHGARPAPGRARLPRLPAGPVLRAARATAATCSCPTTRRGGAREIGKFSAARRRRVRAVGRLARRARAAGRPAAARRSRRSSARKRPADLLAQAALLRPLRKVDVRAAVRPDPAVHREHRRPGRGPVRLRRDARRAQRLRRDRHLGRPAQRRHRVRHAAPPHRPDRRPGGRLGLPARRHGRGDAGDGGARPGRSAPRSAPSAPVARIDVRGRRGHRRDAGRRRRSSARRRSITTAHPPISFLRLVDRGRAAGGLRGRHRGVAQPRPAP